MLKKILIYGVGTFFSKIIVFLMIPIYARVFTAADYGYYDVIVADLQMIVSIAFVEIWSGIMRFMFGSENRLSPVKTFLKIFPFLSIVYIVFLYFLSHLIVLKYPLIITLYGLLYLLFSVSNSICRGLNENVKFIVSGLISTSVACTLGLLFSVYFHYGIEYLLIAHCIGYVLAIFYVEFTTHAYMLAIRNTVHSISIQDMCVYCFPLMLNSFAFLFLDTYNKNIIINQLGDTTSGIYAYIGKFSAIVGILISIYTLAWQEQAFITANDVNRDTRYSQYLNAFLKFIGLGIPVYIIISVVCSPYIGGQQYVNAVIYIPLIVLSAFIANLSGVISIVIAVSKKTNLIFISTVVGAVVNVIIAFFSIPKFGINASSISLCIGFTVVSMLRFLFAKKDFDLVIEWKYLFYLMLEVIMIIVIQNYYSFSILLIVGVLSFLLWFWLNQTLIRNTLLLLIVKIKRG